MTKRKEIPKLTAEHFESVLEKVRDQVFQGKGKERHGHAGTFEDQPWRIISDNVGTGFCLGQSMKKLMELKGFDNYPAWEREALGAVVYIIMAIMWKESNDESSSTP